MLDSVKPVGVDTDPTTVVEAPPEPITISPQNLGSDTVLAVVEPEPSRPEPMTAQEVQRLQGLLAEQRAIQAGLTRAQSKAEKDAAEANSRVEELQAKLSGYQAATDGNEGAISELQAEIDRQRQELHEFQNNLATTLQENEQYKVLLGDYMGDNPIAQLVKAGALPGAKNLDDFRAKMDAVVGAVGAAAQQSVFIKMHGDRPEANPPASGAMPTLDELDKQMSAAMSAGDWVKYDQLKDQRYDVLNIQGLPAENKSLRF